MSVVEFKLKNHKKYNKKILFVFFQENTNLTNSEEVDKIIDEYFKIISENPEIHIIVDSTNVKSIPLKLVMSKVSKFKGNDALLKKNIKSFAVVIKNFIFRTIFNTVAELGLFHAPHIMTDNDKVALNFVVEHLN